MNGAMDASADDIWAAMSANNDRIKLVIIAIIVQFCMYINL